MTDEAREAMNAYTREYRKRNPDKVRKWQQNYWNKKANQQKTKKVTAT